jgi:hypothetical protein
MVQGSDLKSCPAAHKRRLCLANLFIAKKVWVGGWDIQHTCRRADVQTQDVYGLQGKALRIAICNGGGRVMYLCRCNHAPPHSGRGGGHGRRGQVRAC